jgi:uncharacterized protein
MIEPTTEHEYIHMPDPADWRPDFHPLRLPQTLLLALIRLYQLTFSRMMPPDTCRFYPTCSRYGFEAVRRHGAVRGSLLAAWRVLRCNPFNPGGIDPVP